MMKDSLEAKDSKDAEEFRETERGGGGTVAASVSSASL
jgi:hypothetical protein